MSEPVLTRAELERFLDAHGTARERWPAAAWEAAARLLATSPVARALWDDVAAFDRVLGTLPMETPSEDLVARVTAGALLIVIASSAVALTLNENAFSAARWAMGRTAIQHGIAAENVDAGYEWVGFHATGLAVTGPASFGLGDDYVEIELLGARRAAARSSC